MRARKSRSGVVNGAAAASLTVAVLGTLLAACNPYSAAIGAVSATYGVATDLRSVPTQESDTEIETEIKAALLESPVTGTGSISVYCRQGVVLLTGVVQPGSGAGRTAVDIARQTAGVARVETFFVNNQPSSISDFEIKEKIKATLVGDPAIVEGRVDVAVYGGHVVLVGVVQDQAKIDEFVNDADSVAGVITVRSYIQTPD